MACDDAECWQPHINELLEALNFTSQNENENFDINSLVDELIAETSLSDIEIAKLKIMFKDKIDEINLKPNTQDNTQVMSINFDTDQQETMTDSSSPLNWFHGLLNDMGLGFGLATLYFSCFIAWNQGQTPGKMLLNIQVIQLNNSPISAWESFGRYGGYGAGIATGLLGFLQIYWDANRQAIQDKISATVVIDLGLKNRELSQ